MPAGTKKGIRGRRRATEGAPFLAWILLSQERLSVSALARKLGVSEITAKRVVQTLRREGYEIISVRSGRDAYYELRDACPLAELENDPLLSTMVPAKQTHSPRGKPEDVDYDRD